MKKILRTLSLLLALAITGLAIFILTFDADRYRPALLQELQKALGRPVRLERLSLGWQQGIALELRRLAIQEDASGTREPLLEVDSVRALARLAPLLRKQVRISSVILARPRIHGNI